MWQVWLAENSVADAYEVSGIPTFVVIDPDGIIRHRISGYEPLLDEVLGWMAENAAMQADEDNAISELKR